MKVSQIRQAYLDFFASKGHQIVPSSPVVPGDDPTLLFTNAGMNQFKDVFLGFDKRPYSRATTAQKCIRAGGKHNDLDNVGYTARHHTFFEMLGNFSFGDYFKKEAIQFAWDLLTQVFKLPKEKLLVTVYAEDDEAYAIWKDQIGVPADRIIRIGDNKGSRYASDNFWMMGDTGPCGPCTEIFYDHGEHIPGGPPGSPDEDGDRFIEIWNNVFMQFNRDEAGNMHPLPKPSVDTGMGLERIAAVLQHVHSNYEIDLFVNLLKAAKEAVDAAGGGNCDANSPSLKVIADHIRACSFVVVDGVIPGNAGRGYVLRRIARRAIRHGYKLGARKPFFYQLVPALVKEMGDAYPELRAAQDKVSEVLKQEEERFFQTISNGMEILENALAGGAKVIDGETAFRLHDTFGFPLDLTADVCRERSVTVDAEGFEQAMQKQRDQARAAGKFKVAQGLEYSGKPTRFHGYENFKHEGAKIVALYLDGASVQNIKAGDAAVVVLDNTPFYAESGGQVGDQGELRNESARFGVQDTFKIQTDVFGHQGELLEGELKLGDTLNAIVDTKLRLETMRNHSATHILHKALREVLGDHVQQKGSLVDATKTRFDFTHNAPISAAEIRRIEDIVNAEILANAATSAKVMSLDDAQKTGAMMLFGEKYGEEVRVLEIGSSKELCGGTHVQRTGDIGSLKIVSESGVAAGIRRVEAVTGSNALHFLQGLEDRVNEAAAILKTHPGDLVNRVTQLQDSLRQAERELEKVNSKFAASQGDELASQAIDVNGIKVLAARLDGADAQVLRETMDALKAKLKTAAIVLASVQGDKVSLIAGVTADTIAKVKAGDLVNFVALQVGGKGGGKPEMAMAGGTNPAALPAALAGVKDWVASK
ncbi:alanine--tRNA ligase [Polynucleobacter paneuropaeus]|jgi:alanyl-tRNA synthetase|uniref:alanine--tRNA ligase n=1 Tax=Polynucleobacter paneuropaeus TaxID=2527775 RepID=UPI000DBF2EFD|nr:alanine--tRNA ligase [Polynucleobacter paneuropaeus]AWW44906.1 alanine--tRNA ligase [Polynucleobacter paneuropaeus]MBT8517781.1 alanine--tRNA ligase [Polynucleobacter paneuropaeus]MBT8520660.1 alanine--tRNA ligase [Polynucleobacter paneuropaeus]MBT8530259.1 alanine--tRNA ligase [Polynucleobacter paneuropaeus]MBT8531939.1 alanine--tRNA ligase [Polynucleobacter paneuropaeus]